ncbi:MAG: hypothetical protein IJF58_00750 [Clostridia bacterium]|nr:hypothetical protein [Clostridia bacterium]
MKLYKALPILSVLFAFVLSISCVLVLGAPVMDTVAVTHAPAINGNNHFEGTRLVAVTDNKATTVTYDLGVIGKVLSLNRVFGADLYDDCALAQSAQSVVGNNADDVKAFTRTLYGRSVEVVADEICEAKDMRHDILNVSEKNGLLTVTSAVACGEDSFTAVTTLAPCQNEYGYMIISADII